MGRESSMIRRARIATAVTCVLLLAACGGGGSSNARPDPPPASGPDIGFTPTVTIDNSLTNLNRPTAQAFGSERALPEYSEHLVLTNAAGALGAGLTGQGVTIGLLDSGVNRNHPALSGRVTRHFINVNPNTNNTSVDDVVGHGTVVAQIAAGQSVGRWGGGVAQNATIVSSRIISDKPPEDDGSGAGNEIHAGQGYGGYFRDINAQLAGAGAKIINNSWGGLYWNDPALTTELATAWKDFVVTRGGIIVFANGNAGNNPALRPNPSDNASLPSLANDAALEKGWLTVAALDPANPTQLTSYSQECGRAMYYCLAAPGNVVFVDPDAKVGDAGYDLYMGGGTSYAAPQVAGAAAVVWSAFPYFDNDLVRQTILGGAKDLGDPGVDPVFGWGLLDVTKAAKGPSNFAWGDVSVSFGGHSVWRNSIIGDGGLVKSGTGTLTLTETAFYRGDTRVQAGALDVRKGLAHSNVSIANGGQVWGSGTFGGNVNNAGRFYNVASAPATIAGNYTQTANGNLGIWLGSPLNVQGTATLAGQASILGVKSGYTTTSRETLLNATGGISGTFSTLRSAPNVFLDASLAYDANNVFLNINRINVADAVAGMGLSGITLMSAARVENAMQAIDGQLAGGLPGGIGAGFIGNAGALQQVASVEQAERALRSLSGELHASADTMTFDAIDMNRRALSSRFGALVDAPRAGGDWFQRLGSRGEGIYGAADFELDGWMLGSDLRLGEHGVAGFAFGETRANNHTGSRLDHSQDRQAQSQFYLGAIHGNTYALGQMGFGRYDRQMRRQLLLGAQYHGVASEYSGDFLATNLELGHRFGVGAASLTPYVGADHARVEREGFAETGANGFGLRAGDSIAERTQAIAGLRSEYRWNGHDGRGFALRGYTEWQHALHVRGMQRDASFVGVESWAPLAGMPMAESGGIFGLGFDMRLSRDAKLSLGYDQRFGSREQMRVLRTQFTYGF